MELTDSLKALFIDTANTLKGSERRRFMARTVQQLGSGGQRRAERELSWNRQTIRKALRELATGLTCLDAFTLRHRKRAEEHLPSLLTDIKAIVDSQSQADPQFRTTRLYTGGFCLIPQCDVRSLLSLFCVYQHDRTCCPISSTLGGSAVR